MSDRDPPVKRTVTCLLLVLLALIATGMAAGCGPLVELLLTDENGYYYDHELAPENLVILATYSVRDSLIYPHDFPDVDEFYLELQEYTARHEEIWEIISMVIPADVLVWIAYLEIFTDGAEGELGSVRGVDEDLDLYILSIDLVDAYGDRDELYLQILIETVIHELGHILTLNETQLDPVEYEDANPNTYYTDWGDTREDSYLHLFFQRFWVDIYDEWWDLATIEDDHQREEELLNFYEQYESQFVSDYAVTDPDEDIAESFMMFILKEKPRGRTIAEQKITFFYDFSELVELRTEIRENLAAQGLLSLWA